MKYSYLSIDNNIIEDSLKSSLSNCKNLSTKVKTDDKLSCLSKAILMDKIEFVEYKSENESNNSQEELTLKLPKIKNGQTSNEPTNSNQSKDKLFEKYLIKNEWTLQTSQITALRNMGNTCYVNSTLQCLIYTPSLLNYLNIYHAQNCNRPRGKCICCDLYQLIRVCLYGNYNKMTKIISPSQFIAKLKSVAPNFRSHQQQDAHEYLRQLIDKLRICSIPLDKINRHLSKSEIRDISETTAINCIFGGVYDSIVTCKNCNLSSNTKDNFMDLTVDIKDRNIFTIEDALKQLIKPEVLAGQNGYYCSNCKSKSNAIKSVKICEEPNILSIHLKRFSVSHFGPIKLNKCIKFKPIIDIGPFLSKNNIPTLYQLYSVLVHSGVGLNSGHYYSYVRAPNEKWIKMDDSHAMETSVNTVLSENTGAYMMFYRKIQNFKNHKTSNVPKSFLLPRVIEINKPQSQSTLNSATDNRKRKNERISKPTEHKPYFKESYKIKYPQKTKIDKLAFSYTMKAPKNCHNSNESSKLLEYLDCKDYDSLKEKPSSELTKDIFLQKNRKKMKFQFKTKNVFQKHYDKKFNSTN